MKVTKILLSLLLVVVLVVPAFAETFEKEPGDTVNATFTFTSTGATVFGVEFDIPADLKVSSPSESFDANTGRWAEFNGSPTTSSSLTLTFEIPSSAKAGDIYEVKASIVEAYNGLADVKGNSSVSSATIKIVSGSGEHEHTWDAGKVDKEATCTEDGKITYTCTSCGETETKAILALGHDLIDDAAVNPTCTEVGKTAGQHCSRCDYKVGGEVIPATGHKWDNGKVTTEATCTEKGVKTFTCTVCGKTRTEDIAANGHKWVDVVTDATCGTAGEKKTVCSVCGAVNSRTPIPATGNHTFDEGVVTTNPTGTKPGVKTYTCKVCGATKIEEIAPTGEHNYVGKVTKEPTCGEDGIKTYTCTDCGASYTETIPATGIHTPVVRNQIAPTVTLFGYTGDTYCSVCGTLLKIGQRIAPIGGSQSTWKPGRIVPTITEKDDTDSSKAETVPAKSEEKDDFPFTDVSKTDSFYDDVKFVYDNGIMNGVSATEFAPYSNLTRAMIVTILYRVEGEPLVPYTGAFADVEDDQWYTYGVEWAAINGIVNGYGEGKYGPNDAVTLEQLAAILNRYAEYKGYKIENGAAVTGNVSAWALSNVNWAFGNAILGEAADYTVPAYRYEVAIAIHAFCENVAK